MFILCSISENASNDNRKRGYEIAAATTLTIILIINNDKKKNQYDEYHV